MPWNCVSLIFKEAPALAAIGEVSIEPTDQLSELSREAIRIEAKPFGLAIDDFYQTNSDHAGVDDHGRDEHLEAGSQPGEIPRPKGGGASSWLIFSGRRSGPGSSGRPF